MSERPTIWRCDECGHVTELRPLPVPSHRKVGGEYCYGCLVQLEVAAEPQATLPPAAA